MRVYVKLFGALRRLSQPETPGVWAGEVPDGLTLRGLIERLGTREAEVAAAAIGDRVYPLETVVPAGAVVTLVTPVGGG